MRNEPQHDQPSATNKAKIHAQLIYPAALSTPLLRTRKGKRQDLTPRTLSRFVKEIPAESIQEVRLKAAVTRPVSFNRAAHTQPSTRQPMYDTGEGTGLRLGQRVKHAIFGEGVVLRFEGSGDNAVIHVKFSEAGEKRLVMQYAKLEAI